MVVFIFFTYMAQAIPLSSIGDQRYGTDFSFEIDCDSITCDPVDVIEVSRGGEPDTWEVHIIRADIVTITAHTESGSISKLVSILPAPLTITADNKERDYNTENPEWTASIEGLQYDDTAESLDFTLTCEALQTELVGLYEILVILGDNPNYSITPEMGWLKINPVQQIITGITDFAAVYGDEPADLNVVVSSKLPLQFTSLDTDIAEVNNNQVIFKRAGETKIIVSVWKNINFEDVPDEEFHVSIDKAPLSLTGRKVVMQYGAIPDFTQLQDSFDTSGWKYNDKIALLSFVQPFILIDNSITSTTPPGFYQGVVILTGMGLLLNYTLDYVPGDLEIVKTSGMITFDSIAPKQYSNEPFPLYVSHSAGGYIQLRSNDPNAFEFVYDDHLQRWNVKTLKTGSYDITAFVEASEYYDYCETIQTVTITKAPLFVTAIDETRFFGEDNSQLNLSYIFGNFVYPKDMDEFITLPTVSVDNVEYGANKPVGTYPGALVVSGGEHPNYDLVYQNGALRIMPLDAVIDFQLLGSYTYGDVAFPLMAKHYRDNPVYFRSDNENVVKVYVQDQLWKAEITGVGTAFITAYTEAENGYMAAETSRLLTVNPAMLTIRPQDAIRTVGTRNPIFSLIFTGLVNGDDSKLGNIIISCAANESSPPGKYDIVASGAANPNYSITYEKGTLLVTDLTIHELDINGTKISNLEQNMSYTASCTDGNTEASIRLTIRVSTTISAVSLSVDGKEQGMIQPETTGGVCTFSWNAAPGTHTLSIRMETGGLYGNILSNTYSIQHIQPLDASSKLFYQRWNNVLAINNNPDENGVFLSFKSYTWYKNGVQLSSTEGFIKEPMVDPLAEYTVLLTTSDEQLFQTCPAKFTAAPSAIVSAYPSMVTKGGIITVNALLPEEEQSNAKVEIFNLNGQWINSLMLEGVETLVTMPNLSGNYVLNVISGTGMMQQFKVIVY